ncbi:MAG: hypothetical protein QXL67_05825 [Candidatus Bathyarchaeia archaeon]
MSRERNSRMEDVESQLKGKTLVVYWHLLRSPGSTVGVREVQRTLGFSSPSVAHHHLEKLCSLGLVEKSVTGEYSLVQDVKVGFLKAFIRFGRFMVPRYLFYSVWFTTMLIVYLILYGHSGSIHNIVAIIFGLSACLILFRGVSSFHSLMVYVFGSIASSIFWYETYRAWREKPF